VVDLCDDQQWSEGKTCAKEMLKDEDVGVIILEIIILFKHLNWFELKSESLAKKTSHSFGKVIELLQLIHRISHQSVAVRESISLFKKKTLDIINLNTV